MREGSASSPDVAAIEGLQRRWERYRAAYERYERLIAP
jgi:hypothetical protein